VDDIVTELRKHAEWLSSTETGYLCQQSALEIERLRAMILEYVAAETASWPPDDMESYARWEQRAGDAWDVLVAESNRFAT